MAQPIYTLLCSSCRDKRTVAQTVLDNRSLEDLKCTCGGHYQILPPGYEAMNVLDNNTVVICPNCNSKLLPDDLQIYDEEEDDEYYCIYCNAHIPIECILEEPKDKFVDDFWKDEGNENNEEDEDN